MVRPGLTHIKQKRFPSEGKMNKARSGGKIAQKARVRMEPASRIRVPTPEYLAGESMGRKEKAGTRRPIQVVLAKLATDTKIITARRSCPMAFDYSASLVCAQPYGCRVCGGSQNTGIVRPAARISNPRPAVPCISFEEGRPEAAFLFREVIPPAAAPAARCREPSARWPPASRARRGSAGRAWRQPPGSWPSRRRCPPGSGGRR